MRKKTLNNLVKDYYLSFEYKSLREETKEKYQYFLHVLLETKLVDNASKLGDTTCTMITSLMAKQAYNVWCDRGIHFANHIMSVARIVFHHAMEMEQVKSNPFSNVKRRTPEQRKVVWTKQDVKDFLDTAYSEFKYRNVGLIAQMAYEWCQRLGDMRVLKWSDVDLDMQKMHIEQSKRRAEVFLPISDELTEMLVQQKQDFGFQQYIAPQTKPIRGVYEPYTLFKLPKIARRIMKEAGLSDKLRLSDLRRTGTTEMVDAGVSMGNIMSVTGHANPQSVKPYMKNTYTSAKLALNTRKQLTDT